MTEANHVANHMLESILRDLSFLKENNFLPAQTYKDVVNILPSRIQETINTTATATATATAVEPIARPPLPTRKVTMTPPKNNSRELVASFPKLPARRTNDWQPTSTPTPPPPSQQLAITHPEPEKTTTPPPPPPAYTQKPAIESLMTVEALYDYHGEDPTTDLSFKQGNIIEVTEYVNDDWWKGTVNGKSGIFPQNHVKKVIAKPKLQQRPWVPPTSAKPSFSTSNSTSNAVVNNQPYSYPPPPTAMYQPPPQPSSSNYQQQQQPVQAYGQPAPVVVANHEEEGGDKKVHNMAKKFGGHVATAATWGFGATLGSQAASAIF
ncbi:SH3 domain-containing protein [Pilaira anomala]|nr:SH3 domain-containing protein [Pilaira anomala]